mmetsp:Transcript_55676/g.62208  ORF Transcript_55676/g.62208 Transcript_55676/m.62208 type:complete len:152 (-) Transcript_55676:108-563(-)
MCAFRLVAPGIAECHVLKPGYFVNPFTDCVYTNTYRSRIPGRLKDTHVVKLKLISSCGHMWVQCFNLKEQLDTGDVGSHVYKKYVAMSRTVQSCVSPLACPLSTMDHLDSHQHNGCYIVENCQKPENLLRRGYSFFVQPSNVSISSESVKP